LIKQPSEERWFARDHERSHVLEHVDALYLRSGFALDPREELVGEVLDLIWGQRGAAWATQDEHRLDRLCAGSSFVELAEQFGIGSGVGLSFVLGYVRPPCRGTATP
jgi:hypothetical protein